MGPSYRQTGTATTTLPRASSPACSGRVRTYGRDDRECSALHYAIKVSHLNLVLPLLDKDANLAAEDKHGWSVLHYDVRYGDLAITQFPI